ncbi:MAG: GIY-YIG nuclease family protein, partial [bacterium]|nr:GIY-YIG nuclease family protein [bacterium]
MDTTTLQRHQSGVYEIVNTVNGKRYIGSAINPKRRWVNHKSALRGNKHHSPALQRAWNKYGEAVFIFRVIQPCPAEQLLFQEQRALHGFLPEYNIALVAGAPMTGRKHTAQTRATMSKKARGKTKTALHRARISEGQLGNKRGPHTPKTIAKMSAAHKGVLHTEEAKAKIAASHLGKLPVSAETRK